MRAREIDAGPYEGAAPALERGLVGIGDALEPAPESIEEAVELATVTLSPKQGRMLERFASLPRGTLVWTRAGKDDFRLGRITGDWRYADDTGARTTGIRHVRTARVGAGHDASGRSPAAVAVTFDRGGREPPAHQRCRCRAAQRGAVGRIGRDLVAPALGLSDQPGAARRCR